MSEVKIKISIIHNFYLTPILLPIDLETNRDYIWNRIPKEYLTKILRDQNINIDVLSERLQTHLISRNALNKMLNDDFSGFLEEREKTIKGEIRKLLEIF